MHVTFGIKLLKKSFYFAALLILVSLVLLPKDGKCAPQLLYVSAPSGPNYGWENSTTKGAAITIWGYDLGTSRGTNTVTVAGVTLANDSSYAEWGATTNPQTAKGMQRITFWLNNSMSNGNTVGLFVTVNGVRSNTLPFTISNTGATRIRFVDPVNGRSSNNGQYAVQVSGANGPWKYPFEAAQDGSTPLRSELPGMFIYLRGGTYHNIQAAGYRAPLEGIVGMNECETGGLLRIYPLKPGTAADRITMTSYPGEHALFSDSRISSQSDYRTYANMTISGTTTSTGPYMGIVVGMQEGYCTMCTLHTEGNQIIGMAFTGYVHTPWQIWGNNTNVVGNYMSHYPTAAGMGAGNSYSYVGSSENILIQNNEFHKGSRYAMQMYDETRNCPSSADAGRGFKNNTIDSNLFDMNVSDIDPQPKSLSLLVGMAWPPSGGTGYSRIDNLVIKNNVWNLTDAPDGSDTCFIIYQEGGRTIIDGIYFYNNTCNGADVAIRTQYGSNTTMNNLVVKNNIFSNIVGNHYYTENSNLKPSIWNNNLTTKSFSSNVTIAQNMGNIVGNPLFVSPSGWNFRLQVGSPAIGSGVNLFPVATRDFDWQVRPATSAFSIGAFEYGSTTPANKSLSIPAGITLQ